MKEIKNANKGFTLLELLVVVLIIGILAAIALPQYQMAVGKAKFSTLKTITRDVQASAQRYYLIQGTYEGVNSNLDITIPSGINCMVWVGAGADQVACNKEIFGIATYYYVFRDTGMPRSCHVYSTDIMDKSNRLCQKETGKVASSKYCNTEWCSYSYY